MSVLNYGKIPFDPDSTDIVVRGNLEVIEDVCIMFLAVNNSPDLF